MPQKKSLKGINKVLKNLNKEIMKINNRTMGGLISAAADIREDMDNTPPLIPVETSNLRGSWFTNSFYVGKNPAVQIGFNAEYAAQVHEKTEPKVKWSRPGSGPKFLEAALKRNFKNILETIKEKSQIKK